ncbi:MAG: fimbria/pilus periplasmic chaperone [Sphaerochaetaceae bacterium]|nr:fimbria/pilus periplasmic chaperone [Sphaerochaetaceae bacterium]
MLKKNLLFLVVLLVSVCSVCAFQFSPLEQTFNPSGDGTMKTYTIINDSDDQIAISLSVLQRDQDANGNEVRSDASSEFLISPSKIIVNPQSTYVVKVQYRGSSTVTVEKAYRLMAEQVPYSLGKSQTTQSMFNFLYVYATSLYVTPSEEVVKIDISAVKARVDAEGNKVMDVTIRNRGNVHQILLDSVLTVSDANGNKVVLSNSEDLVGIDSINILARKTITKTIAWPEKLPFVEGGSYTGSLSYSD